MAINVAIIGVGNCAKSLVEGVAFYTKNKDDKVGLMHHFVGKYHPSDINFVAAFDVDERKVGKKLHEAINAEPNKTMKIADSLEYDVVVQRGPTDGSIIPEMRENFIHESKLSVVDVAKVLEESNAEIVLNYLPTGSDKATYDYAEAALKANCSFINCMPTSIAKDLKWRKKFEDKGLVLMGDDIKSQCGATIVNRFLLTLFKMRGIRITESEQVNYGGNADHFNLHYRPESKEEAKEAALNSVLDKNDAKPTARMVYTEKNYDHKQAKIKIRGEMFGHVPVSIDLTLEDEDSPNSGGVVMDAIRAAKFLVDNDKPKEAKILCSFLMKSPPKQLTDSEALKKFNEVILPLEMNKFTSNSFKGVIIEESLENKDILKKVKIIKTKVEKITEEHKTPWLKQWTLHTVEILKNKAKEIAEEISKSLDSKHSWYADFKDDTHHYIIFRNKVFFIDVKSKEQYDKAKQYGISLGIPEYQVDFHPEVKEWER